MNDTRVAGLFCRMRPARFSDEFWSMGFFAANPQQQYGTAAIKPAKFEDHDPSGTAIIAIRNRLSSPLANNAITLIHP
jgi:hypothetical protein